MCIVIGHLYYKIFCKHGTEQTGVTMVTNVTIPYNGCPLLLSLGKIKICAYDGNSPRKKSWNTYSLMDFPNP